MAGSNRFEDFCWLVTATVSWQSNNGSRIGAAELSSEHYLPLVLVPMWVLYGIWNLEMRGWFWE